MAHTTITTLWKTAAGNTRISTAEVPGTWTDKHTAADALGHAFPDPRVLPHQTWVRIEVITRWVWAPLRNIAEVGRWSYNRES